MVQFLGLFNEQTSPREISWHNGRSMCSSCGEFCAEIGILQQDHNFIPLCPAEYQALQEVTEIEIEEE
jgi:hypothetical protein